MHKAYLSLGTNIGNRKRNISDAVALLSSMAGTVTRLSSLHETEPWGFDSPNRFINACALLDTPLSPTDLLHATQEIEKQMGRTEKSVNGQYHDRIIDIDILLYDDITVDLPQLHIPHPHMHERDFVMRPLTEILQQ